MLGVPWSCQFNLKSIGKTAIGKLVLERALEGLQERDNIAYVSSATNHPRFDGPNDCLRAGVFAT